MAAPSGYSVPIGQGTGLGSDINVTPVPVPPPAPGKPADEWTEPPKAPGVFVPSANSTIATEQDDFAEPDIFIPAPGQKSNAPTGGAKPPASNNMPPSAPSSQPGTTNSRDDDDDNDNNQSSSSNGGDNPSNQSTSYRDLAARFDNLKNL